jgi:lysozyme
MTKPYYDSEGVLTAGYGRNLAAVPFSRDEIDLMFENDFRRARDGAESFIIYPHLNRARRGVLVEMVFQMGVHGVSKFRKFLAAALEADWQAAHDEMLDSRWHDQTPERAQELARIFLRGE